MGRGRRPADRRGPLKILFFTDYFRPEPSAPAAHVYERAKLWVRWGHEVTVITSAPNFPEGKVYAGYENAWRTVEVMDGVRVVRVKTFISANQGTIRRSLDQLSYPFSALLQAQREPRPDVVLSTSPPLFCPLAGIFYAWPRGIPHVFEVRDIWPASILAVTGQRPGVVYRILEALELWMYRRSARLISFTRSYVADLTGRGVAAGKIDVVVNAANLELFTPRPPDEALKQRLGLQGRFVVGYLGTIGLAHDLGNVVAAARLLADLPVTFLLVGVGADKVKLEGEVRAAGLDNVRFVERQLKEAMPSFWSLCDLSLVHLKDTPLFAKVIPSKIFESMAMGVPILFAGPEGEGAEIVRETGAGLTLPPGDPVALARGVRALVADPERVRTLARASLAAAPRYSRDRQARESLAALEKAVGTP
jgi:colanic acid biosynthesis glycosyl transferase WcaI